MGQESQAKAESVKPRLLSVSLPRPVSLAGAPNQHFTAVKYRISVDEDGDVTIQDARGNFLFVPKSQAILEYAVK